MPKRYTAQHWGIYEVEQRPGQTPLLRPFGGDPDPSPIGLDILEEPVQRLRVRRPAIRRSWLEHGPGVRTDARGQEPFVEVDWDTAFDRVAAEIARIRDKFGNSSIFGGSYGWASAGRFHHAQSQLHRFFNMLGGYVRSVDSYSLGAGRALMGHILAPMDEILASHTSWDVLAEHTKLFVGFGGVPLKNAQISPGGAGDHRVREALRRMTAAGVRFINISPVRDNLETGDDVEWIPIRPNTDTALMLALAYVLHREHLEDPAFLERYCSGFDKFLPYLDGIADGMPKTPEWAAAITGVPAARTVALAHEMAGTRTMLNIAYSLQRAAHGEQPFWMIMTLAAMLGQIGLPGGGFGMGYGAMNGQGSCHAAYGGPVLAQGLNRVADFIPVARIADLLLHPGEPFTYNGETHRYADIRLVYWAGGNPFHHHQDLNRLLKAWRRPETIVVQEQYWTPAARHADIVLPVSLSLERDDIGYTSREGYCIAMRKAAEPLADAQSDYAIFSGLADRLGIGAEFTEGLDEAGWLRRIYEESRPRAAKAGVDLPPFDQFWEEGLIDMSAHDRPVIMLDAFRRDPIAHPLRTPSGRIEIFSERIAGYQLDDCPGYPAWREPFEWLGGAKASTYPLHLLSDQPARRLHSQLDSSSYSLDGKIDGREPIYLNSLDAAARGIGSGDLVEIFNDRGRCHAGAIVTDDVMQGVARLATGAWFDPHDEIERRGNPNVLTLDRGSSAFSQGCIAQTCLVDVVRVEGGPLPIPMSSLPNLICPDRSRETVDER